MFSFAPDPGPGYPDLLRVVIEIPKGSANLYEYDEELKLFRLSRALYSPMHYPGDYGFIPGTLADDGKPLDVLVLVNDPSFPGCVIEVRPVGVLNMRDRGTLDQKLLAVPHRNPRYDQTRSIDDVFSHLRLEIEHFFEIYKELEGSRLQVEGWGGLEEACQAVVRCRERYLEAHREPEPELAQPVLGTDS